MSTETETALANAAQLISDAERNALQSLLDEGMAFMARVEAINASLPYPIAFRSDAKNVASGIIANISHIVSMQLPMLIQQVTPPAPIAPASYAVPEPAE